MGQNDSVDLLDCNQRGFFFFYMSSELLFLTDVSAFSGVTGDWAYRWEQRWEVRA